MKIDPASAASARESQILAVSVSDNLDIKIKLSVNQPLDLLAEYFTTLTTDMAEKDELVQRAKLAEQAER